MLGYLESAYALFSPRGLTLPKSDRMITMQALIFVTSGSSSTAYGAGSCQMKSSSTWYYGPLANVDYSWTHALSIIPDGDVDSFFLLF